ncbi:MAG: isochorismatase family protein [Chloroflexota bacterium]
MRKEAYFTPETLQAKAREMLLPVEADRRRHAMICLRPREAALLVLDMQDYFLQPDSHAFVPAAPAIVEGIARLRDAFLAARRPVVFTRHVNTPEDAGMMSTWWRDLIAPQDARSQIIKSLDTSNCILLEKRQYDAFWGASLDSILRGLGVGQVVVTGVMTHLCCETTARSAFVRGFEVFFAVDGAATYTESLHRASLLTLAHGFAIPVLVDEIGQVFDA